MIGMYRVYYNMKATPLGEVFREIELNEQKKVRVIE